MKDTVDEIEERLAPSRLLADATASVSAAGRDSVRRHPLSTSLLLAGLGLLMARRSRRPGAPSSRRGWLARHALAVGAAVAAAGTVAGVSRSAGHKSSNGSQSVTR